MRFTFYDLRYLLYAFILTNCSDKTDCFCDKFINSEIKYVYFLKRGTNRLYLLFPVFECFQSLKSKAYFSFDNLQITDVAITKHMFEKMPSLLNVNNDKHNGKLLKNHLVINANKLLYPQKTDSRVILIKS